MLLYRFIPVLVLFLQVKCSPAYLLNELQSSDTDNEVKKHHYSSDYQKVELPEENHAMESLVNLTAETDELSREQIHDRNKRGLYLAKAKKTIVSNEGCKVCIVEIDYTSKHNTTYDEYEYEPKKLQEKICYYPGTEPFDLICHDYNNYNRKCVTVTDELVYFRKPKGEVKCWTKEVITVSVGCR